jgi:hypothetical protein
MALTRYLRGGMILVLTVATKNSSLQGRWMVSDSDWLHSPKNPSRQCRVEGCTNLGASRGLEIARQPECTSHSRRRRPTRAEAQRRHSRKRLADGTEAASRARQIQKGERIRNLSHHHLGVKSLLGGETHDGLTVSRTCPPDCPDSYVGYDHRRGEKVDYPLCSNLDHYVLETLEANLARGSHSLTQ